MQAENASTTRRALFAVAAALPVIPALASAAPAVKVDPYEDWPEFIRMMEWISPKGGKRAALQAHDAGMQLGDLNMISLTSLVDAGDEMLPILMFKPEGQRLRIFRPRGED